LTEVAVRDFGGTLRKLGTVTGERGVLGMAAVPMLRMYKRVQWLRAALVIAVVPGLVALSQPSYARAATTCDLVAATDGNDADGGSLEHPLRTVQALADRLAPGQTGCLRAGVYYGDAPFGTAQLQLELRRGATLTRYRDEIATIVGRIWVPQDVTGAVVEGLILDGTNAYGFPSPTINGSWAIFRANDVSNANGVCFNMGSDAWGAPEGTLVERNKIHDCVSAQSSLTHGVYVQDAVGTVIRGNWIYDNGGRGIQLFPNAQFTRITENVLDSNGVGVRFAGYGGQASSGTVVEHNLITNSDTYNVDSWYLPADVVGENNVVSENCVTGGKFDADGAGVIADAVGFAATDNTSLRPHYISPIDRDYRLTGDSPCRSYLPDGLADSAPGLPATQG
jgi:hypothetical protein